MFWRWRFFATHGPDEKGSQAIFIFIFFLLWFLFYLFYLGVQNDIDARERAQRNEERISEMKRKWKRKRVKFQLRCKATFFFLEKPFA
jgi:hypothetical protein